MAQETFAEEVERRKEERETNPGECSHCGYETTELTNHSRHYGGNVGAHWLCSFCENTLSASALGAGNYRGVNETVRDVASMLNILAERLTPLTIAGTDINGWRYLAMQANDAAVKAMQERDELLATMVELKRED